MRKLEQDLRIQRVLVIDFCETLVNLQSADNFVEFVANRTGKIRKLCYRLFAGDILYRLLSVVMRVLFDVFISRKEYLAYFLMGIERDHLARVAGDYCREVLVPSANLAVVQHVKDLVNSREYSKVIICSGGYSDYIHVFCQEMDFDFVDLILTSQLAYYRGGNRLAGGIAFDCMGEHKVKIIGDRMREPYKLTTVTDSISDWPLMRMSDAIHFIESGKVSLYLKVESSE